MTTTRKWTLLAAVLAVAVFVGGWFLLIAPKRTEAAALRADTVSQEEANQKLVQQLEILKAQQADLPQQRAKLALIRKQIPSNPALPSLIRNLTAAGRQVGADIINMSPALPVAAVAQTAPVAATSTSSSSSSDSSSTDETAAEGTAPAAVTPAAPTGPVLYQVPLTVKVNGSYFELEQFVNKLEGLRRSFLVTGFTVGPPSGDTAVEGDLEIAVTGRVFMTQDPPAAAQTPTTASASAPVAE